MTEAECATEVVAAKEEGAAADLEGAAALEEAATEAAEATSHNQKWLLKARAILEDPSEESDDDEDDTNNILLSSNSAAHCNPAMAELLAKQQAQGEEQADNNDPEHWTGKVRKGAVAVTGGTMVAVGAVLVPCPLPLGVLTMAAGMGVLSTEFEGAQNAMDTTRDKLAEFANSGKGEQQDGDGAEEAAAAAGASAAEKPTSSRSLDAASATQNSSSSSDEDPNLAVSQSAAAATADSITKDLAQLQAASGLAPSTPQQEPTTTTKPTTAVRLHQKAAQRLRRKASHIKESIIKPVFQPLAGKTVEVYDQLKQKTKENSNHSSSTSYNPYE